MSLSYPHTHNAISQSLDAPGTSKSIYAERCALYLWSPEHQLFLVPALYDELSTPANRAC